MYAFLRRLLLFYNWLLYANALLGQLSVLVPCYPAWLLLYLYMLVVVFFKQINDWLIDDILVCVSCFVILTFMLVNPGVSEWCWRWPRDGFTACREPLALPPYTKMFASTARHSRHSNRTRARRNVDSCQPHDGFVMSNKAWCARKDNGLYTHDQSSSSSSSSSPSCSFIPLASIALVFTARCICNALA